MNNLPLGAKDDPLAPFNKKEEVKRFSIICDFQTDESTDIDELKQELESKLQILGFDNIVIYTN